MQVLRASDYKRMPWKNGGGETVEIAVFPPGASVNDFDWRISMATVASDGPFSIFLGIDRTLSILDGNGMSLAIDGDVPTLLVEQSEPLGFAADVRADATLVDGTITDLNVMTRRGRFSHRVEKKTGRFFIADPGNQNRVLLFATGKIAITSQGRTVDLGEKDAIWISAETAIPENNIVYYVIRLETATA